jgi:hypothetical protein
MPTASQDIDNKQSPTGDGHSDAAPNNETKPKLLPSANYNRNGGVILPRALFLACLLAFSTFAAETKGPVTVEQSDELVRIVSTLYLEPEAVVKAIGRDPGFPIVVVEVKFSPRGENKVPLWLDDFTLLSHKDGQRSLPLTPTQLAGRGGISVNTRTAQGPRTGGTIGLGPIGIGRPHETPTPGTTPATEIAPTDAGAPNPLLVALKEKVLPERETSEDSTGLLYFLIDGKLKPKDLELIWKSSGHKLMLEFGK